MINVYDELKLLIDSIQSVYSKATRQWEYQGSNTINLKKCQVCDIDINGAIYKSIIKYVKFLNEQSADIILKLPQECSCGIIMTRVKAQNSIESKIHSYNTPKHECGKIPLNKCFNDLFGIRIILTNSLRFDEISSFIAEQYKNKYKCIDSSKLDYKATHLYFKESNYSFPWELQIWNSCDKENNFASHKKHKQAYTDWEKESMEGGISND